MFSPSLEHCWFQKLEYILWRERSRFGFFDASKLAAYQITSKNSVEHVHPQWEEFGVELAKVHLDSFGNLVLLSPSENLSYSNQRVGKKREDFKGKAEMEWDAPAIDRHQAQMLLLIKEHYDATGT
ncbi:HNH endonuclease family protein [Pseudomonas sp. R1-6]|uniref:HNH endonuclease family protein n=1 Tax=Pseudomonas sp. R1-6 TaxID=2817397 RepID=UPI003DA88A5F